MSNLTASHTETTEITERGVLFSEVPQRVFREASLGLSSHLTKTGRRKAGLRALCELCVTYIWKFLRSLRETGRAYPSMMKQWLSERLEQEQRDREGK